MIYWLTAAAPTTKGRYRAGKADTSALRMPTSACQVKLMRPYGYCVVWPEDGAADLPATSSNLLEVLAPSPTRGYPAGAVGMDAKMVLWYQVRHDAGAGGLRLMEQRRFRDAVAGIAEKAGVTVRSCVRGYRYSPPPSLQT